MSTTTIDTLLRKAYRAAFPVKPPAPAQTFRSPKEVAQHLNGYSDDGLNRYIVAKAQKWLADVNPSEIAMPANLAGILLSIQVANARSVVDFGGGAPTVPKMLDHLGIDTDYRIVESPAFAACLPSDWLPYYVGSYSARCDLLVLSGVLHYLPKDLCEQVYATIKSNPPRYIYLGRTTFLEDAHELPEVYTIQQSRFGTHGAQVPMGEDDEKIARYAKRHFKWPEVGAVLEPYEQILSIADDSGVENLVGVPQYSRNGLFHFKAS